MKFTCSTLVWLVGCATASTPCPTEPTTTPPPVTTTPTCDTSTTPTDPGTEPTKDELAAMATWVSGTVSVTPVAGGPSYDADRISIVYQDGSIETFDVSSTTRGQDHNSSRSNKSGIVAFDDDFAEDDEDTTGTDEDLASLTWDGAVRCAALPCVSQGHPDGATRRLEVSTGTALDDGSLSLAWAETTPMTDPLVGTVEVGTAVRYRGHVTVLKAADDGGDVVLTTAYPAAAVTLYNQGKVVYSGTPVAFQPLGTVEGNTGASWPKGVSIEAGPVGTEVSFTF